MMLALVVVLSSATAFAQSAPPPPTVGGKPLVQVKPHAAAAAKKQPLAVRLQSCLDIDDGTKERLNCYDAVVAPTPKDKAPPAKAVTDCKFTKEEDARLACFNGFVEAMPKLPSSPPPKSDSKKPTS
jgi:hypothetical protein